MGAAAAIIMRRQREIVDSYRSAGAVSPEAARDPGELGIDRNTIFRGLVDRAVLREAGGGRYYLDGPSWEALGRTRRRAAVVIAIALVALAIALVFRVSERT